MRRASQGRLLVGLGHKMSREMTPLDSAVGALLGLACGDAVGTTLEFKPPGTFGAAHGHDGRRPVRAEAGGVDRRLIGVIGAIDHASRPVRVVNVSGIEMDGRIRHSTTNGQHYFQLNNQDPEITDGLRKGDVIRVELVETGGRLEVRLHTTTPSP